MAVKPSITRHEFQVGDMVWAKLKSQPWWPGHVYNEELATPLVRQSKKKGLLLVALFGASSYCWFDSSDLIPFDSNYAEKSTQIGRRSFVRAVEDAIEEVSRRIGVGLRCMCRNKQNFRKINVQGFVSVDVGGCDSGSVYSIIAIGRVRDGFKPSLTVDFVRQLALDPAVSEDGEIDVVKNKAAVLAYRKAVYEDFDQASGYDPAGASVQEPAPKASLTAREMFAFKDPTIAAGELNNNPSFEMSTSMVESSTSSSVSATKTGQQEGPQNSNFSYETELSQVLGDLHSLAVDPFNTVNQGSCIKGKKSFLRFRSLVFQKGQNFPPHRAGGEANASKSFEGILEVPLGGLKRGPSDRQGEMAAKKKKIDDIRNLIKKTEQRASEPTMLMMKFPLGGSLPSVNELKERFARYGPMDHSGTQISRHTFSCRVVFKHKADAQAAYGFVVQSSSLFGNTSVKCCLKEVGDVGAADNQPPVKVPKDDHHPLAMEDRPPSMFPASSGVQVKSFLKIDGGEEAAGCGGRSVEDADLSRLLRDLHSLAVDPFNMLNIGSRVKGKKAFLRFRSLLFQKRRNVSRALATSEPTDSKSTVDSLEVVPVKPHVGFKRDTPDREEETVICKLKKVGDIIDLTKKKKVIKIEEQTARDVKQSFVMTLKKPGSELIRKTENRVPEPTLLMIKFPKGGSLPSYNELKAQFTRYGPMDHSGTHIFWNTFSCQVVFRHKVHAQSAYKFVVGSSSLFGNTGVKCHLKVVGTVGSAAKAAKEDRQQSDTKDRPPVSLVPTTSGVVQVKSILKKSGSEEEAGGDGRGHVKFMLGAESHKAIHPSVASCPPLSPTHLAPPSLPPCYTHLAATSGPLDLPLMTPNTDIAQQMLSLLARCNDVVMNVCSILGYTPYHPL